MKTLVARALQTAAAEVGQRETSENRGVRIDQYQRATGYAPGVAWCACFVWWSIEQAAKGLLVPNPVPRSGRCRDWDSWALKERLRHARPEEGDIFLLYYPGNGPAFHTGLVAGVEGGEVVTLEGNTDLGGDAEGDGVYRRRRKITTGIKFIRWGEKARDPKPPEIPKCPIVLPNERLTGILEDGVAWAPLRAVAESFGRAVSWDMERQMALVSGVPVTCDIRREGGQLYVPARELGRMLSVRVRFDPSGSVHMEG